VALATLASQLIGCAQKPAEPIVSHPVGTLNPPMVISGSPKRDAAAFTQSQDQLSDADWKQLEKLGPRPVWQQILQASHQPPLKSDRRSESQPLSSRMPSTQSSDTLSEAELPVQMIDLPEARVRMIWTLRSYGGPSVKSARDANTNLRTIQTAPPDLTPLITVLNQCLGTGGTATALPGENSIVVTCSRPMRPGILALLNDLDRPPRQVEITAKIFEVSHDFDFQQGTELVLDRLASNAAQNLTSTFDAKRFLQAMTSSSAAPVQGSVLHLMQAFQSAGVSVDVSFQLLAEAGLIQVVSEPRMTVAVGQTGYMLAGQEIPIQSTNITNNALVTSTQYKPVGVQLYITPEAASAERVKLHTISIVSAVAGFTVLPTLNGNSSPLQNPVIESREAETAVTVDDGSTLVISGMRMIRTTTREDKIPGLGDVPLLGWLFKNHRTQQQQTDLYFFITPTLL